MLRAATLTMMVVALASPLYAQSQWLGPSDGRTVWLEMLLPQIDEDEIGFATMAGQVGGRFPIGERLAFVAELPFAHADLDLDESDETGTTAFGNPYVGLELGSTGRCTRGELGARVPLAPDDNAGVVIGLLGDLVDRAEAFAQDAASITVGASRACPAGESGWTWRLRGAGSVLIPVDDNEGDTEFQALYGVQAWYQRDYVIGVGLTGRAFLNPQSGGDLADRTVHQIGGAMGYDFGAVRPMIEIRVPLDEDLRDVVPTTIGLGVVVRP